MPQKVWQRTYSTRFNDFALEFYSFVADNYAPSCDREQRCLWRRAGDSSAMEKHVSSTDEDSPARYAAAPPRN